jgi:hypothetical protein
VLVNSGDRVDSTQVVGRTSLPTDFRIVAVARLLGVTTSEAEACLQVSLGDTVHRGDVLAKRGGLIGRSIETPIDGILTAMGGGRVLIEAQPAPFELHAYISGSILSVRESRTITIETVGALIEGAWGCGEESVGVLKSMTERPDEALHARAIDPSCHGSVLVTGTVMDREPLQRAENVEARGILTGGLAPDLVPAVKELSIPTIVTEGLGELPMMGEAFNLLKEHEGREVSISGETKMRWNLKRPEIIIPLPNSKPPTNEKERSGELRPGARVRVIRMPHMGSVGTVREIPQYARRIATGARVRCAEVDIDGDDPILVPLTNLDILS